ncbi:MAG TPA: VOC family protein [Kofleriaceae bacterium]|nr:VOC family protein [Kofleriaceae bacterium]
MREPPRGWPRIASSVFYEDARAAIDWLCRALGFEARLVIEGEGGRIEYSELVFGGGQVMVQQAAAGSEGGRRPFASSPRAVGGSNTQAMCVCVDDVDAACERARAAGATIASEPATTDHGEEYWADRTCEVIDPEGHHWWLLQRVREGGPA